jgi:hypothetical protein
MGQGAVRIAIQQAIQDAQLPLVGTVFPGRAYIDETDYESNAAQFYVQNSYGSACVIVVNLPGPDKRNRFTLTGRQSVNDFNIHPIVLELFFASRSGDPIQAQTDYDVVVDALVPFIRNNPTMSAPDVVWSAGEYKAGVVHTQSSPFTLEDGMTVFINGAVRFEAWEQVIGVGV